MTIWELECKFIPKGNIKAKSIRGARDFHEYFKDVFDKNPQQEALYALYLDIRNHPICLKLITLGLNYTTQYHPREVLGPGMIPSVNAMQVAIAHNHPGGDPAPSQADKKATIHLRKACEALNINLRDHIIVGDRLQDPMGKGYFSFWDQGYLNDDFTPEHLTLDNG